MTLTDPERSASKNKETKERRTGLGSKVNGPTKSRTILNRIDAVVREGRELADEPLRPPPQIIAQPGLFCDHLRTLRRLGIVRDACTDSTRGLRERGESRRERCEEEGEVRAVLRSRRERDVRFWESVVRVRRLRCGGRGEEGRGEEEGFVGSRIPEEGQVRDSRVKWRR
jgi:hypothetical protein